jgi:hypothetical protein
MHAACVQHPSVRAFACCTCYVANGPARYGMYRRMLAQASRRTRPTHCACKLHVQPACARLSPQVGCTCYDANGSGGYGPYGRKLAQAEAGKDSFNGSGARHVPNRVRPDM